MQYRFHPLRIWCFLSIILFFSTSTFGQRRTLKTKKITTAYDWKMTRGKLTLQDIEKLNKDGVIDTCEFDTATFKSQALLSNLRFLQIANFDSAHFTHKLIIGNSLFEKDVDFSEISMADFAIIHECWFHRNVYFNFAVFHKFMSISAIEPGDSTDYNFSFAVLPNLINFSRNGEIFRPVDFIDADFSRYPNYNDQHKGYHYINLFQTDLNKIEIDYQHFRLCFYNNKQWDSELSKHFHLTSAEDQITVNHKVYNFTDPLLKPALLSDKSFITYLSSVFPSASPGDPVVEVYLEVCLAGHVFPQRLSEDETCAIYQHLLKNFELSGQKKSYELLDVEFQDFIHHGWFNLPHIWYLYGYRKFWIFWWTAGFLLFFTCITFISYNDLNKKMENGGVYFIDNIPVNIHVSSIYLFFKRLWSAAFYTSAIFFLVGLKIENINFRKIAVIYILIVYAIGIMCLGYLANFILQK